MIPEKNGELISHRSNGSIGSDQNVLTVNLSNLRLGAGRELQNWSGLESEI